MSYYLIAAQVARVSGLILPSLRFACFSPGERSSSGLGDLLLLFGVNLDLRRADIELVVEVLSMEAASELVEWDLGSEDDVCDWLDDMADVVCWC